MCAESNVNGGIMPQGANLAVLAVLDGTPVPLHQPGRLIEHWPWCTCPGETTAAAK